MVPEGWKPALISDVCRLQNGRGFKPEEWAAEGLPIIRIQNLNGGTHYNYFAGKPDDDWLVNPGQMLFAWAGTKGVSFGPTIWRGETGVLNQHIFKVFPRGGVDQRWLFYCLQRITKRIESKAHGFKATLVHVKKSEIANQAIAVPPLVQQQKIAAILATWDRAIEIMDSLIEKSEIQRKALCQVLLTKKSQSLGVVTRWRRRKAKDLFLPVSIRKQDSEPLLAVTQEEGVVPRDHLDRRVAMPTGEIDSYKLVVPGNFVISLRSFQGGLEYSRYRGLVSPAYTVLEPKVPICAEFYRHYFKSYDFIGHLAVAVVGIRDGKQISYGDFSFLELPYPSLHEQERIATMLSAAETVVAKLRRQRSCIAVERDALLEQLLAGKRRVSLKQEAA